MNRHIKNLYIDNFYKKFVCGRNSMLHLLTLSNLQNHLNQFVQKAKQNYLNKVAKKLSNPSTSLKCYWSLLKTLLNDKKYHEFHLYFITTSTLLILKKRVKSSTLVLLSSVPSYLTKVHHCLN